jgi:hypothetical protein
LGSHSICCRLKNYIDYSVAADCPFNTTIITETPLVYLFQRNNVKIISAIPGTPSMNKEEVEKFIQSKLLLQIGTVDDEGDPNIQPVWFDYDKDRKNF